MAEFIKAYAGVYVNVQAIRKVSYGSPATDYQVALTLTDSSIVYLPTTYSTESAAQDAVAALMAQFDRKSIING